jgi:hypothetical protein
MAENYINLNFDEEKTRLTVLTNICRMLVTRGYMSLDKYGVKNIESEKKKEKKSIVESPSENDKIDNDKFLPHIQNRVDNNIYILPLDTPYKDQRDGKSENNHGSEFDGTTIIVKLIPQTVKDISNSPILNDFFKTYPKNHKIIVFDGMSDKVYNMLSKKKNVEVFDRDFLMIDLMSHICAPISCEFVTNDDIGYITNPKMAKMHENDPLSRYYNAKKGNIMGILRPSLNNSKDIVFRKIIESKPYFK